MTRVRAACLCRFALLASIVALSWPALSLAQPAAATDAAATNAQTTETAPSEVPGVARVPLTPATRPSGPQAEIVLVLPLGSPDYGRAAEAVRSGFLAAAAAASVKPLVIAHGDGGVQEAFTKARAAGARVIVGPLLRDDVKWVALTTDPLPWTIALNQLDDTPVSDHVVALALAVESDARQIAKQMSADGAQTVAIVASDSPLSKRFATAFADEWLLRGGGPPIEVPFERSREALAAMHAEILKKPIDAVVLAIDAADAVLAKPYLGQLPVYAGSQVNDRMSTAAMRDLDNVKFVEIPWIAEPDSPRFSGISRGDYRSPVFERLYALGIDAFRVAQIFAERAPQRLEFDGAIGHLSLEGSRQFSRDGKLMQFRSGDIVPADAR